jgi:ABC-type polysaccharide/polyol phosphate transport system ATPase subunit
MLGKLCERALWLDHGQVVAEGPLKELVPMYEGRAPMVQDTVAQE